MNRIVIRAKSVSVAMYNEEMGERQHETALEGWKMATNKVANAGSPKRSTGRLRVLFCGVRTQWPSSLMLLGLMSEVRSSSVHKSREKVLGPQRTNKSALTSHKGIR